MASNGKKVFDVSKPGKAKPSIGAKPMIVGHKSVSIDPMMKDKSADQSADKNSTDDSIKVTGAPKLSPTQSKVKVEPISADMKRPTDKFRKSSMDHDGTQDDGSAETKSTEAKQETAKKTSSSPQVAASASPAAGTEQQSTPTAQKKPVASVPATKPVSQVQAEATADDKQRPPAQPAKPGEENKVDPAVLAQERAEEIRKLAESKKYRVNIREGSSGPLRSFLISFVLAVVVGFAVLYVLIDTGVIDVEVELPFTIFGE